MNILEAIKSGREVKTKIGYSVKILTTEARSFYPIVGLAFDGLHDICLVWNKNGKSSVIGIDDFDLVVKPKKVTKWFNVYNFGGDITTGECVFDSKEVAQSMGKERPSKYICTKSFEIEL